MAYASWSVVFGEQPSAAKWNILGTNDASFNDGTGIATGAITPEKLNTGSGTSWVWTSHSPTYGGFSANPSGGRVAYIRIGKLVYFHHDRTSAGTSNTTAFTISLPVAARTISGGQWTGSMRTMNNGVWGASSEYTGLWQFGSGATTANIYPTQSGAGWTASGSKNAQGIIVYESD